jgi:ABC-type lipoprotein release transport system permease subunit
MEKLAVIIRIAFRNLFASRLKTVIVGGIIFFGAVLVVLGSSMLDSVDEGMSRSIVGSAAGNIQVYSAKSKDDLAIWGQMGGDPDLTAIDDFSQLKTSLEKVPNVKAVVPMGISGALVTSGNTIDLALADLRDAVRQRKDITEGGTPAVHGETEGAPTTEEKLKKLDAVITSKKAHIRHIIEVLQQDRKTATVIVDEKKVDPEQVAALAQASSPEFWDSFDKDPYSHLEFLENKIASQATDADLIYLRYIGTDFDDFEKSFDRMQLVDGQLVPEGQRGFLFAKKFYEDTLKLRNAHRLDVIKDKLADDPTMRITDDKAHNIKGDADLQRLVKQNTMQTREIVLQLDGIKADQMTRKLQGLLGSKETDLEKLLADFFNTTDENFQARYDFFYKELAPMLDLYRIRIGDNLTIKAYTKSGYVKSVNVKVYGTFQFKGLEKSALSGSLNLVDMASFRDLYGFLTPDSEKEIEAMKKKAGATEIARDKAEDELFGTAHNIEAEATPGVIDENAEIGEGSAAKALREKEINARVFTKDEIEKGAVLNAAVFVKDDSPQALQQTMKDLEAKAKESGLDIKTASWQKASGLIGQFVIFARLMLYAMIIIIFSVALVIINNALVMATLERVREIGTLRAIGAQKRFILQMLFVEAVVVGLVFGAIGAGFGSFLIKLIDIQGIKATTDVMYFFFSGPRLFPFINPVSVVGAFIVVLIVSAVSSFYPGWLAMRVSPLVAMQTED